MGDFYINRKRERERVGKEDIGITKHSCFGLLKALSLFSNN